MLRRDAVVVKAQGMSSSTAHPTGLAVPVDRGDLVKVRRAARDANERVERLTESLRSQLGHWHMRPVVEALMTLGGTDLIAARR